MSIQLSAGTVERFRSVVEQRLGLRFDDDKLEWLGTLLQKHAGHPLRAGLDHYVDSLASSTSLSAWSTLLPELTVAETYFFRNMAQFDALRDEIAPKRLGARDTPGVLRCLSAGCATGEEAYSIAMTLASTGVDASVQAIDLNPANLVKARLGRYGDWSLRETPAEMRQRWFKSDGKEHVLDASIRRAVDFEVRNLMDADEAFWQSDCYDVIFCRNVLMYFTPERLQAVLARLTRALVPGGYLFLGHAESLRGLTRDFHLRHTHGTFYYQRKSASEYAAEQAIHAKALGNRAAVSSEGNWMQAIGGAADRVRALTSSAPANAATRASSPDAGQPHTKAFEQAFELFRQDRFNEALAVVSGLSMDVSRPPEMRLLHAVLLVHSGLLAQAEQLCLTLLQDDEFDANAHHLLALCREGAGDHLGAVDSDQTAAYLDPGFAMPHLHLGLLARRQGDRDMVRKELSLALRLLSREDATRLQLFGGGFNRDALSSLCAAELAAHGAT